MTITKHVIKRFQERITYESPEVICSFIKSDVYNSTLLYRINNIEKRVINGIVYVLDFSREFNPKVVTLYLVNN